MPGALAAWLVRLGPLAIARPAPSFGRAVAGVGGALAAAGVVLLGGDRWASSESSTLAVVLLGALLAAGVVVVVRMPPPGSVAGVAASGIAAPALAFFLAAGGGFPSVREVAVLSAVLLAGLYLAGPWRGHTFHLAILVVAGWMFALSLGDFGIERSLFGGFGTLGDVVSGAGASSMVLGVVYLGLGSWLHDEGLQGMATPFLAVAALALPVGTFALLRESAATLQGLVAMAAGAVVALVGARCRRQGSTWIGVAVVAFGVVRLSDGIADSAVLVAVLVVVAGAGLVLVAPMASALVDEAHVEGAPSVIPPVGPAGVPSVGPSGVPGPPVETDPGQPSASAAEKDAYRSFLPQKEADQPPPGPRPPFGPRLRPDQPRSEEPT